MSGDVFGNGMLLSRAHRSSSRAFDHRHVFLDPDPDPDVGFAERQRLFDAPPLVVGRLRPVAASRPGAASSRALPKSIALSPEVQASARHRRQRRSRRTTDHPRAPARAGRPALERRDRHLREGERPRRHADVGDKANDAVRVDAHASCGAGSSARAATSASPSGPGSSTRSAAAAINTDAIDNSAGVDCSDHEVNIKILLDRVVADGELTREAAQRAAGRDDRRGGGVRSCATTTTTRRRSPTLGAQAFSLVEVHARYIAQPGAGGHPRPELEFLPDRRRARRAPAAGAGLTTPEFAVLLAYTKIALVRRAARLRRSRRPVPRAELARLLPHAAARAVRRRRSTQHPLRREIIATAGHEQRWSTGAARRSSTGWRRRRGSRGGDRPGPHRRPRDLRHAAPLGGDRGARQPRRGRHSGHDAPGDRVAWSSVPPDGCSRRQHVADRHLLGGVALRPRGAGAGRPAARAGRGRRSRGARACRCRFEAGGVPCRAGAESRRSTRSSPASTSSRSPGTPAATSRPSATYFLLADRLRLDWLRDQIVGLPRDDRWHTMARATLRADLYDQHRALTADIMRRGRPEAGAGDADRRVAGHPLAGDRPVPADRPTTDRGGRHR